ncbi:hypothetical protein SAMN05518800_6157 [Variovorax sp. YR752]|uniref:hypothetical protein n=1 Tax=Variovorax sp. YR752 TaxID=1884383 RepID=UPI000BCDCD3E|nr:hypothetical protein [Variovorax sp. YR752]SOD30548.1 hypothetical protein SAMN05518800_6157 [Variovorax sp. YR752]
MQTVFRPLGTWSPLGPTESRYVHGTPHQNVTDRSTGVVTPGQGTMRAHHIADHEIQLMICDYMNGTINMAVLLDRIGALYLTSWVDVIVTPRLFKIWLQWSLALAKALTVITSQVVRLSKTKQAEYATRLSEALSSSVANLRVGHAQTDVALAHGVAPRMQRGVYDLFGYFIGWLTGHNFAQPTLSVETSLVSSSWDSHYTGHLTAPSGTSVIVNNVFIGPGGIPGSLFISEEDPLHPATRSTRPVPQRYPGTTGLTGYVLRSTRSITHLGVIVLILTLLGYKGKELIWPRALPRI